MGILLLDIDIVKIDEGYIPYDRRCQLVTKISRSSSYWNSRGSAFNKVSYDINTLRDTALLHSRNGEQWKIIKMMVISGPHLSRDV